jgi:glycosyltransferase involved in cell wall biosynthesis
MKPIYDWLMCIRSTRYKPQPTSTVEVYTDNPELFPDYHMREGLSDRSLRVEQVSLVATVKDEASSLLHWLNQMENQTRRPDEVVVVDGGSNDGSIEILSKFARKHSGWFHLHFERGVNIARGRNIGIRIAKNNIIAVTDVGCDLDERWLENLIAPFEANENIEVVAGWYESISDTRTGTVAKNSLIPSLEQVDPESFLPSSRSLAFRKTAWESVGGYPEWLTLTAEDTFFALELKRACSRWAFVPEAVTVWHAPSNLKDYVSKVSSWAFGDGEAGLSFRWHIRNVVSVVLSIWSLVIAAILFTIGALNGWLVDWRFLTPVVFMIFIVGLWYMVRWIRDPRKVPWLFRVLGRVGRSIGFLRGVRNRPEVWSRRYQDVPGIYLIMAVVPIDDTGGGARSTQLALELLNRGYLVYYIHKFPKYESIDLGQVISHPNLIDKSTYHFAWESFAWECAELLKEKALNVILELPHKQFVPIIKMVKKHGGRVIYDLIDEWGSSLGATWYSTRAERSIIDLSDILVATAPQLQTRLTNLSGREVVLAPNAVNLQLFNRRIAYPLPGDISPADFTVIYVGALWGEWFDWDLLRYVAQSYQTASIIVIGDYKGQCPSPPPNLQFLGLKPQTELPPYLAHADVAIIPWHISPITHATSPLKVYEFLAMGLPVVAPKLDSLELIPYVLTSIDRDEFNKNVEHALNLDMDEELLDQFLDRNSWKARVDQLIKLLEGASRTEVKL